MPGSPKFSEDFDAREIRQLQNQIDVLNRLLIPNKFRILLAGFHENFRADSVRVSGWRVKAQF